MLKVNKIAQKIQFYWMLWRSNFEKHPITHVQVEEELKKVSRMQKCYIEATDRMFMTTDLDTIKKLASLVPVRHQKYVKEEHDCENFAFEFKAIANRLLPYMPIGYCHVVRSDGVKHALNFIIYVTKSGRLSFSYIEPQSGKISFWNYKPYLMVV